MTTITPSHTEKLADPDEDHVNCWDWAGGRKGGGGLCGHGLVPRVSVWAAVGADRVRAMGVEPRTPPSIVRYLDEAGVAEIAEPVGDIVSSALISLVRALLRWQAIGAGSEPIPVSEVEGASLTKVTGEIADSHVLILWPGESFAVILPAEVGLARWESLWLPGSEDLVVLCPEDRSFVFVDHEEWLVHRSL